jgi:hypothetical protein
VLARRCSLNKRVISHLVLSAHKPLWAIPLEWLCDIGTIAFLWASPRLISDLWQNSAITKGRVDRKPSRSVAGFKRSDK